VDKTEFVTTEPGAWWLVTPDYYVIEEQRKELGLALGVSDQQWYLQVGRLEELHRQLEVSHYQLLTDLDQAQDDNKRLEWLTAVVQALKPTMTKTPAPAASEAAPQPAPAPAAKTSPFVKKSPFAKKRSEPPPAESAEAAIDEAVKGVVAELTSSPELAAELGMTEIELQSLLNDLPTDFESRVAAEAARLASQG
jgi:hypothetical protein